MKFGLGFVAAIVAVSALLSLVRADEGAPANAEKEITADLAKLSDADRKLAEAQRWCAVENDNRLGSMGTPLKVMLDGKPVFLCCAGCKKKATANPAATLAKVEKLKKVNAAFAKLPAADRSAAEAQKFCAVQQNNPLGSMGAPLKVLVNGQPVFLCCAGCKTKALANPQATLATVAKLKQATAGETQSK